MNAAFASSVVALATETWGIITIILSIGVVIWVFMKANKKDPGIGGIRARARAAGDAADREPTRRR